jgi:hypothetical protein
LLIVGGVQVGPRDGPGPGTSQQSMPGPHAGEHGGGAQLVPAQKSFGALQTTPQAPQLWMSLRTLTQAPSQQVNPIVHRTAQGLPPPSPCSAKSGDEPPPSPSPGSDDVRQAAARVSTNRSVRMREAYSGARFVA